MSSQNVPFVVARHLGWADGIMLIEPIGIEFSFCQEAAGEQALRRWPEYGDTLLEPQHWEDVFSGVRLMALEADRRSDKSFNLHVGILL